MPLGLTVTLALAFCPAFVVTAFFSSTVLPLYLIFLGVLTVAVCCWRSAVSLLTRRRWEARLPAALVATTVNVYA